MDYGNLYDNRDHSTEYILLVIAVTSWPIKLVWKAVLYDLEILQISKFEIYLYYTLFL